MLLGLSRASLDDKYLCTAKVYKAHHIQTITLWMKGVDKTMRIHFILTLKNNSQQQCVRTSVAVFAV